MANVPGSDYATAVANVNKEMLGVYIRVAGGPRIRSRKTKIKTKTSFSSGEKKGAKQN
jgi:hypothetical protein